MEFLDNGVIHLMKHSLLLFFVFFSAISTQGQIVDVKVKSFIEDQKIDSFLVFTYPCSGYSFAIIDSCEPSDAHYLIWVKNNEFFIKRFQFCKTSKSISISSENPLSYYILNRHLINKEKIKPPTYYEYRRTKKGIDTLLNIESIDHSCYHAFTFSLNKKIVEKSADTFDLNLVKFDNGRKNIYYNYNQNTHFKHLIDDILMLTNKFDNQKSFEDE